MIKPITINAYYDDSFSSLGVTQSPTNTLNVDENLSGDCKCAIIEPNANFEGTKVSVSGSCVGEDVITPYIEIKKLKTYVKGEVEVFYNGSLLDGNLTEYGGVIELSFYSVEEDNDNNRMLFPGYYDLTIEENCDWVRTTKITPYIKDNTVRWVLKADENELLEGRTCQITLTFDNKLGSTWTEGILITQNEHVQVVSEPIWDVSKVKVGYLGDTLYIGHYYLVDGKPQGLNGVAVTPSNNCQFSSGITKSQLIIDTDTTEESKTWEITVNDEEFSNLRPITIQQSGIVYEFSFVVNGSDTTAYTTSNLAKDFGIYRYKVKSLINGMNQDWYVNSCNYDWVTAEKEGDRLRISLKTNTEDNPKRVAKITLTQSVTDKTITLVVNQVGANYEFYMTTDVGTGTGFTVNCPASGYTLYYDIKSTKNDNWIDYNYNKPSDITIHSTTSPNSIVIPSNPNIIKPDTDANDYIRSEWIEYTQYESENKIRIDFIQGGSVVDLYFPNGVSQDRYNITLSADNFDSYTKRIEFVCKLNDKPLELEGSSSPLSFEGDEGLSGVIDMGNKDRYNLNLNLESNTSEESRVVSGILMYKVNEDIIKSITVKISQPGYEEDLSPEVDYIIINIAGDMNTGDGLRTALYAPYMPDDYREYQYLGVDSGIITESEFQEQEDGDLLDDSEFRGIFNDTYYSYVFKTGKILNTNFIKSEIAKGHESFNIHVYAKLANYKRSGIVTVNITKYQSSLGNDAVVETYVSSPSNIGIFKPDSGVTSTREDWYNCKLGDNDIETTYTELGVLKYIYTEKTWKFEQIPETIIQITNSLSSEYNIHTSNIQLGGFYFEPLGSTKYNGTFGGGEAMFEKGGGLTALYAQNYTSGQRMEVTNLSVIYDQTKHGIKVAKTDKTVTSYHLIREHEYKTSYKGPDDMLSITINADGSSNDIFWIVKGETY